MISPLKRVYLLLIGCRDPHVRITHAHVVQRATALGRMPFECRVRAALLEPLEDLQSPAAALAHKQQPLAAARSDRHARREIELPRRLARPPERLEQLAIQ